jgi:hypothetical protein
MDRNSVMRATTLGGLLAAATRRVRQGVHRPLRIVACGASGDRCHGNVGGSARPQEPAKTACHMSSPSARATAETV